MGSLINLIDRCVVITEETKKWPCVEVRLNYPTGHGWSDIITALSGIVKSNWAVEKGIDHNNPTQLVYKIYLPTTAECLMFKLRLA